jgi:hypothetical protein
MAWYAKMEAIKGTEKGSDGASDTFMFADAGDFNQNDNGLLLPAVHDLGLGAAEETSYGKVQFQDFHFNKRCDNASPSDDGLLLPAVHDAGLLLPAVPEAEIEGGWYIPLLA